MAAKKPLDTAVSDESPRRARKRKDFRDAYLNVGFYDSNRTAWTENSFTLPDGTGDTFGPNHPNRPAKLDEVRNHTAQERKRT